MTQQLWWYAVRASGVVAWVLVTASVVWGLLLSARATTKPRPAWVLDLHRFLGGLTFVFLAVHLVGLLVDEWVGFGPRDLFVPMAAGYRPGALAWGIVATYLLVAVQVTSMLMRRVPRRVWHGIHLSSFVVFATTTVHALTAGTDSTRLPTRVFALVSVALVTALTVNRLVLAVLAARRRRAVGARLPAHRSGAVARTLRPVDEAIEEVVRRGDARHRSVARLGHHRTRDPRGTPR
jgi:predicted ferric reductase